MSVGAECPTCGFTGQSFEPGGTRPRPNARCPTCRSLERHRLAWLYLSTQTDLLSGAPKRMLHVAPEPPITRRLREAPWIDYVSADLDSPVAMVKMDITDIPYPDASFDVAYCSHVLEHVPDDRRAMSELFRVLRPGGWAILQVPIWRTVTEEDLSVTDPEERTRRFGQFDHVRSYGRDYAERLASVGFSVTVDPFPRRMGAARRARYGVMLQEEVHFCRKVPGSSEGAVRRFLAASEIIRDPNAPEASTPVGRVDRAQDGAVSGWAWRAAAPTWRVAVRVFVDSSLVGSAVADLDRPGLARQDIGDGRYGFQVPLPESSLGPGPHHLRVQAEGDVNLPPTFSYTSDVTAAEDPWYVVDYSPPGGFW